MTQLADRPFGTTQGQKAHGWWQVLLTGLSFYCLGLVVLIVTENPNIFPTVVMLGTFLVPAAYVAFFYERRHLSDLSLPTTFLSFFYGGVLGVFAAALLEPLFIQRLDFLTAFGVGLIEEFVKILGVLVIARHQRHDSELDGLILGAGRLAWSSGNRGPGRFRHLHSRNEHWSGGLADSLAPVA